MSVMVFPNKIAGSGTKGLLPGGIWYFSGEGIRRAIQTIHWGSIRWKFGEGESVRPLQSEAMARTC